MKPTPVNTDPEQLDVFAWKATSEWDSRLTDRLRSFDADYIELTRWFLWDKVGRAIRASSGSKSALFERELMGPSDNPIPCSTEGGFFRQYLQPCLSWVRGFISKKGRGASHACRFQRRPGPLVYLPVLSDRLIKAAGGLICKNICQVVVGYPQHPLEGATVLDPTTESQPSHGTAMAVYKAIIEGLDRFGITLLEGDARILHDQVLHLTALVKSVRRELETIRPDAILVHGDNHPPFQAYVLAAREMGIPSIMLQHGLDCEQRYLDEAYASAIAVWGPARAHRYRERSNWQPNIAVTGNPEYDHLRAPVKISTSGDYWLWVTRPHTPQKCYAPSRTPEEGLTILYALIEAMKKSPDVRLVIKPHPSDYRDLYAAIILSQGLQGKVELSTGNIQELITRAALVITEDSTAGLDAMFAGKLIVHAHLAECLPTMPFVDYGAALPGFSKEQLIDSLLRAGTLRYSESQKYLPGQISFLSDYAGICDGGACDRFVEFVGNQLCQK